MKKLLSILLAAGLLLSLAAPVLASEEAAADVPEAGAGAVGENAVEAEEPVLEAPGTDGMYFVDNAVVTGFVVPKIGEKPCRTDMLSVPAGVSYHVYDIVWREQEWGADEFHDFWGGTFRQGYTYQADIILVDNSGIGDALVCTSIHVFNADNQFVAETYVVGSSISLTYDMYGETYGQCGADVSWSFAKNTGNLLIHGTGPMANYSATAASGGTSAPPWSYLRYKIETVEVAVGVTSIGDCALAGLPRVSSVYIDDTVQSIGSLAFYGTGASSGFSVTLPDGVAAIPYQAFAYSNVTSVTIPATVRTVRQDAFWHCEKLQYVYYGGSQNQWNHVDIELNNDSLTNANKHYSYAATVTVTFDNNGHGGSGYEPRTVAMWGTVEEPDAYDSAWTFGGWYTDKACTHPYDFSNPVTEDMTLYAKWTPRQNEVITEVNLRVPAPGAGSSARPYGGPDEDSYYLFTIEEQYWCTGESKASRMGDNEAFVYGKTYYFYAELAPKQWYEFPGSSGPLSADQLRVQAFLKTYGGEGTAASSVVKTASGHVEVFIPVKAAGIGVTGNVSLKNFTIPTIGSPVQTNVRVVNWTPNLASQCWSDDIFGPPTADETFRAGKTYYWNGVFTLAEGLGFGEDYPGTLVVDGTEIPRMTEDEMMAAYLEDRPVHGWYTEGDTMTMVLSYVPESGYAKPIDLTLALPVTGETAPDPVPVEVGSELKVTNYGWIERIAYEPYNPSISSVGSLGDVVGPFEEGRMYYLILYIETASGLEFGFNEDGSYPAPIRVNGVTAQPYNFEILEDAENNGRESIVYGYNKYQDCLNVVLACKAAAEPIIVTPAPKVTLSADAKNAQAESFAGLYARVALVIDNNGVSGLYVTQATINEGGEIIIPSFMIPGLTVKGVNVALVPTLADIQKSMPTVKASDSRMLG